MEKPFPVGLIFDEYTEAPMHPGEAVAALLEGHNISATKLARDLGVSRQKISHVINGKRKIDEDLALRLGNYFDMDAGHWIRLQTASNEEVAMRKLEWRAKFFKPVNLPTVSEVTLQQSASLSPA